MGPSFQQSAADVSWLFYRFAFAPFNTECTRVHRKHYIERHTRTIASTESWPIFYLDTKIAELQKGDSDRIEEVRKKLKLDIADGIT